MLIILGAPGPVKLLPTIMGSGRATGLLLQRPLRAGLVESAGLRNGFQSSFRKSEYQRDMRSILHSVFIRNIHYLSGPFPRQSLAQTIFQAAWVIGVIASGS